MTYGGRRPVGALVDAPPPEQIADLARACVDYVKRALHVELDFSAETLPMLDHYLMTRGAICAIVPSFLC